MTEHDPDRNFLQRWSRQKLEEKKPDDAPPAPGPETGLAGGTDAEPVATGGGTEAGENAEAIAGLPDIETLGKDSDYTGFLRAGVPEALQNMALRKLWLSDPMLANLDGLNDYDDDFGAILKEGAAFMKRLVDAGEKITRPGAEKFEDEGAETEDGQPDSPGQVADAGTDEQGIADRTSEIEATPEAPSDGLSETESATATSLSPGEKP